MRNLKKCLTTIVNCEDGQGRSHEVGHKLLLTTMAHHVGGRRRFLTISTSPTHWALIARHHHARSPTAVRLLVCLALSATTIAVVRLQFRDGGTLQYHNTPSETDSTSLKLFARCAITL